LAAAFNVNAVGTLAANVNLRNGPVPLYFEFYLWPLYAILAASFAIFIFDRLGATYRARRPWPLPSVRLALPAALAWVLFRKWARRAWPICGHIPRAKRRSLRDCGMTWDWPRTAAFAAGRVVQSLARGRDQAGRLVADPP
jgi:hypothetical protein